MDSMSLELVYSFLVLAGRAICLRELFPLVVSLRPVIQEALFLRELGLVGFYLSLAYMWFDLGECVCFNFVDGVYILLRMFFF